MTIDEEMNQIVTCRYCGGSTLYGEMMWLSGKEMCPKCYMNKRAAEDAEMELKRYNETDSSFRKGEKYEKVRKTEGYQCGGSRRN